MTTTDRALRIPTSLGTLHVRVVGSGPPAVLWHSMFVDSTSWDRVAGELAHHRTLYLVDAPSAGRSDALARATDIAGCAAAATDLLAALDVPSVDWVGNAWGGHVGMRLAATPDTAIRSLVAISAPTHPIDSGLRRKVRTLVPLYRLFGPRGLPRRAIEDTLFTDHTRANDPEALGLLTDSMRRTSSAAMVRAIETAILNRTDLTWAAQQITCPTLFVTTDDRGEWTPDQARAVAERMVDAREVTIAGARVIPAIEQPVETAAAITAFWTAPGVRTDTV
ncbi:alpha/beta hydrolase [Williamsia sp. 1138]|uniref:alpha/beta fold hydrolase n=1 Tax=Williamsia sp. 1138 TaxID=1903117 RepID=UPI001FEFB697|nr:alpha/beta hydrolase [Williamsia sp. 1138]